MSKRFAVFGNMTWPLPEVFRSEQQEQSVQWKLRYAPESLTDKDKMYAASVLAAYSQLIKHTAKQRPYVIREIRAAMKARDGGEGD